MQVNNGLDEQAIGTYERDLMELTDYEKEIFKFAAQKGFLSITKCMKRPYLLRVWSAYTNKVGWPYAVIHLGHRYSDITVVPVGKKIDQGLREKLEEALRGIPGNMEISSSDLAIKMIPRNKAYKLMLKVLEVLGFNPEEKRKELEKEGENLIGVA
jgi:hypothetical protein